MAMAGRGTMAEPTENELFDALCCPLDQGGLDLQVVERSAAGKPLTGSLRCRTCQKDYPLLRGVPRFASDEQYAGSFGYEWLRWSRVQFEDANIGKPMEGHTRRMFYTATGLDAEKIEGRLGVELGCGPGRFLDIARKAGSRVIGLELSRAVEAAHANLGDDPGVLLVQGDLLRPPLRREAFDFAYSLGVLHHTPDPAAGFTRLASLAKPGGMVSCCVYPDQGFYAFRSVARMRWLFNRLRRL